MTHPSLALGSYLCNAGWQHHCQYDRNGHKTKWSQYRKHVGKNILWVVFSEEYVLTEIWNQAYEDGGIQKSNYISYADPDLIYILEKFNTDGTL